jgi:hypothetical protein
METWHRLTFNRLDNVDEIIEHMDLKKKKVPTIGQGYILIVDIAESDARWSYMQKLAEEKQSADMFDSIFTDDEILASPWVRLMPVFERGFAQPRHSWRERTYDNICPRCGVGYSQKEPFRIASEPRMSKNHFLSLVGAMNLFCVQQLRGDLERVGLSGYETMSVIIHPTNEPSKTVCQVVFPIIAGPALADEDRLSPERCEACGITKYGYLRKGRMHLKASAIGTEVDCQMTNEWFGSGARTGFREFLVSHKFAAAILRNRWRGVRMKPVDLV